MAYELDGHALRAARQDAGLTQNALSELLGVAGAARVSAWEQEREAPHPNQLRALSLNLGVPVRDLLRPVPSHQRDLARLRVEAGLSVAELAARIDVPVQTLKRWEGGRVRSLIERAPVAALSRALGAPAAEVTKALGHTGFS